jgi:hypothetical protein
MLLAEIYHLDFRDGLKGKLSSVPNSFIAGSASLAVATAYGPAADLARQLVLNLDCGIGVWSSTVPDKNLGLARNRYALQRR